MNLYFRLDDNLKQEILTKIESQWPGKNSIEILTHFEETLQKPELLSVFKLDSNGQANDIDVAILRALLKAKKNNFKAQLKLALSWNLIDIAKNFIFNDENTWEVKKTMKKK